MVSIPGPNAETELDAATEPDAPSPKRAGPWKLITIAAAVIIAFCALALAFWKKVLPQDRAESGEPPAPVHSFLSLPPGQVPEVVVISPAGDQIVYQALRGGSRELYRRYLNEEESRLLPGSEGGTQPFFSPDGKDVGFFAPGAIRIVSQEGTRDLVPVPRDFALRKAIWAADRFVYYTTPVDGIWRVPARGGTPEPVLKPAPVEKSTPFYFPQQLLPGDPPALLFSTNNGPVRRWISWTPLGSQSPPHVLLDRAMGGQVASGYLLSWWQGKLRAAPFNVRSRALSGSPVDALSNVGNNGWRGPIASMSANGTLVFVQDYQTRKQLVWVDRSGKETPLPVPPAGYEQAEVSPDGTRVSIARQDGPALWSLWIFDLRTGGWTPVLNIETPRPRAIWNPDSKQIVAATTTGDAQFVNLYRFSVDNPGAAPERLTDEPDYGQFPGSWSAARKAILFTEGVHVGTQSDIHLLSLDGQRRARPIVATAGIERCPAFSPDGQWFTYSSDQGTGDQVFIQP